MSAIQPNLAVGYHYQQSSLQGVCIKICCLLSPYADGFIRNKDNDSLTYSDSRYLRQVTIHTMCKQMQTERTLSSDFNVRLRLTYTYITVMTVYYDLD